MTVLLTVLNWEGFSSFISGGTEAVNAASDPAAVWKYTGLMVAFAGEVLAAAVALSWGRGSPEWTVQVAPSSRKLSKRSIAAAAMILLAIPLTIYVGIYFFGDRKYYFISLLIILESMLPFALIFESRKPQARELVIIAVLCAIGVAGRVAFFMLPQFKPVVAMVIIAGVAFGGEAGFLVGAVTGFVSNMFFGQGPLTPVADVCVRYHRLSGGRSCSCKGLCCAAARPCASTAGWRLPHLRRDYEPGGYVNFTTFADVGYAVAVLFTGYPF